MNTKQRVLTVGTFELGLLAERRGTRGRSDPKPYVDSNCRAACIFSALGFAISLVLAAFVPSVADALAVLGGT